MTNKTRMKILIIDNYDSFTYNLVQLVEQCGTDDYLLVKNDRLDEISDREFDKVLISPGPGIASEAGGLLPFVEKHLKQKCFLGICLGYEAIAQLCGGKLIRLPEPMHGLRNKGKVLIDDGIFKGLPREFYIGHYHSWIIGKKSLPEELEATMEDENGLVMAFRHRQYNLTGLQFHPESVMTEYGLEMIGNWI
ncbi:MAG: aminodeoxychorismate/anthranilate synthase component II, partial [Chlorobi bacterium]|nr:aminodeoxychorismate/anthranilate synthase component II [Chlorobiota bacterium]